MTYNQGCRIPFLHKSIVCIAEFGSEKRVRDESMGENCSKPSLVLPPFHESTNRAQRAGRSRHLRAPALP